MPVAEVAGQQFTVAGLVLDKDGTLLDFGRLWGGWAQALGRGVADALDGVLPVDALLEAVGTSSTDGAYDPTGPLAAGSLGEVRAALATRAYLAGVDWPRARAAVDTAEAAVTAEFDRSRHVALRPGAHTLLERAAELGIGCALVTADDRAGAIADLEAVGVLDHFTAVIGDDDVERGKPAPDAVLAACERLGVEPAHALMVGDTANDLRAARAAGLAAAIGTADAGVSVDHLPGADAIVRGLDELCLRP